MHTPRFSIVIPTRDRPERLGGALRSVLAQTFDDIEIIVSDNSGDGRTRAVVRAEGSDRVRYVRAPEALLMHDHWAFALMHARGAYAGVLCDDDALHPRALHCADRVLRAHPAEAVYWRSCTLRTDGAGAHLHFGAPYTDRARAVDARALIDGLFDLRVTYTDAIPKLLNGLVSRALVDRVHAEDSTLTRPASPDYAATAITAQFARGIVLIDAPLLVTGATGASIGVSAMAGGETARRFVEELRRREPRLVLPEYTGPVVTWFGQTLLQCAREMEGFGSRRPNPVHLYGLALREIDRAEANGVDAGAWRERLEQALAGPLATSAGEIRAFAASGVVIETETFIGPPLSAEAVLGVGPCFVEAGEAPDVSVDAVAAGLDEQVKRRGLPLGDLEGELEAWAGPRDAVLYGMGRNGRALLRALGDVHGPGACAATTNPSDGIVVLDEHADQVPPGWRRLAHLDEVDPNRHVILVTTEHAEPLLARAEGRGFRRGDQVRSLEMLAAVRV